MEYIQLTEINELPDINNLAPFKVVLVIEDMVSKIRIDQICRWIVEMGGLYVMICGTNTRLWKNSIRLENLDQTDIHSMMPDQFVMITNHEGERLKNVFWHAKIQAIHSHAKIENFVVVHVANVNRKVGYSSIFNSV